VVLGLYVSEQVENVRYNLIWTMLWVKSPNNLSILKQPCKLNK